MRVFNVNKAIGYASSGVEYAQKYRQRLLKNIDWVEDYYIFTDYITTNLCVFTDLLGFPREKVIWIYNELAGRETKPCTLLVEDFAAMIRQEYIREDGDPKYTDLILKDAPVRYRIWKVAGGFVDRVDTIVSNKLERVDHYDESLNNVEYYQDGQLNRRVFYDEEGSPVIEQLYQDKEITRTVLEGKVIEGRSLFFQYFFKTLFSKPDDVVIVDRALDVIDGIYPVIGNHRLFSVVHAEHYDLKQVQDDVLLWNNHYEYVFSHADWFDGIIVSTNRQKEILEKQLIEKAGKPNVVCIPVGTLKSIQPATDYEKCHIMTASRLASEKHIDWLIQAVCETKKSIPDLHIDIYGEGKRMDLENLVANKNAKDFISLKGHQVLDGIYEKHACYVTASTSEGFGLSIMEAIGAGLPIVGFDVDYGNREMVEDGVNGRLFPYEVVSQNGGGSDGNGNIVNLAKGMIEVLSKDNLEEMRAKSREKAKLYLEENVQKRWENLLRPNTAQRKERLEYDRAI